MGEIRGEGEGGGRRSEKRAVSKKKWEIRGEEEAQTRERERE